MDYLSLAKEKVSELVNFIQILSDEDKSVVASFLIAVKNNKVTHKDCINVLNIHKRALRKSFKLHRHAKREYGVKTDE